MKRNKRPRAISLCALLIMSVFMGTSHGADLGAPRLSDGIVEQGFFDPARFVTSGGIKYEAPRLFTLEPQLGVGYERFETVTGSGFADVSHKVLAQGGGRLDLSSVLYLSAAAKLPLYTYETTGNRAFGNNPMIYTMGRGSYDLFSLSPEKLSWTGEAGIHLGVGADLNIFFDQTPLGDPLGINRPDRMEERFGTRFIFRFH